MKHSRREPVISQSPLKEKINKQTILKLIHFFDSQNLSSWDPQVFLNIIPELKSRELKARVVILKRCLQEILPSPFKKAYPYLLQLIESSTLDGFEQWIVSEYISDEGLHDFEISMKLLYVLTQTFTSEFAIRPFLNQNPRQTLSYLSSLTKDSNVHVRRWASEGTRPFLPWGVRFSKIQEEPHLTLNILRSLAFDPEEYVQKSVSNHLNDLSRINPSLVLKTLRQWERECPHSFLIQWKKIIRRSLRTLIKKGNPEALKLIGVDSQAQIKIHLFEVKNKKIKRGDFLEMKIQLESHEKKELLCEVDYEVGFKKANGQLSFKIYKWKKITLKPNEIVSFQKKHSLRPITTMAYYPGEHTCSIQINGQKSKKIKWVLI